MAADLVGRQVAVIAAAAGGGTVAALAAKATTTTIPIVFTSGADPVAIGLVASLSRPGGNVTGIAWLSQGLGAKRLGLLHELVPQATPLGVLMNPNFPPAAGQLRDIEEAARAIGLPLDVLRAGTDREIDTAFESVAQHRIPALLVGSDPFFDQRTNKLVALAARHAVPAIYGIRDFAVAGGLMSYGPSLSDAVRQAGVYTGRILKGVAAELHRQFRMVVDAAWYRALFPAMRPARDSGTELVTTAGGGRYATSVGGTLTGRGADLIIIDDPLKAEEAMSEPARKRVIDWYAGTLVSRLNDKEHGPIVVVMQRLHENDLAGYLLGQGGWEHLDLPSIAVEDAVIALGRGRLMKRRSGDILHPERESKDALDRIKAEIGSLKFSAQYQQRPVPLEGNLIRRDWFRYYEHLPQVSAKRIVQSWDIAMMTGDANDYSVCTTWQMIKADYYLLDVFRGRLQYPDLRRKLASLAAKHGAGTILFENAGPGMALLQDLWRDLPRGMPRPLGRKPEGSKADRMIAESGQDRSSTRPSAKGGRLARHLPP